MIGLVFEGGGAKGAYQIGVWKYIKEKNIKISGVAGTSVGAVNSAAFAMGDIDFAVNIWSELSLNKILKGEVRKDDLPSEFNEDFVKDLDKLEEYFLNKKDGLDITPMKEMLKEQIN